ncbi:hypothetical protein V6N12_017801 [Hibiscus sabdariffa]|uniref:Uncharacterized protein n=1 Tax=Hibiscus sabdariffa TaxID=183260 RepID=A0ABR2BCD5_9ROSI
MMEEEGNEVIAAAAAAAELGQKNKVMVHKRKEKPLIAYGGSPLSHHHIQGIATILVKQSPRQNIDKSLDQTKPKANIGRQSIGKSLDQLV